MRVVPNVVDTFRFHPPPAGVPPAKIPRLLSVGLLYDAKGIDMLLTAVSILVRDGIAVHVEIVGDGELRAELEAQAAALGLARSVSFLGLRSAQEIAELMRSASLFVLPSRYDNNPVALIEALASGLPAIASDVGGVADIVGDDGILTAPMPEAIAAGIAAGLTRLGTFDRPAIAARARRRYGTDELVHNLTDIYRELVNERASQRHARG
jgi:glycosyltransferase involved in cell wall biosynthesis